MTRIDRDNLDSTTGTTAGLYDHNPAAIPYCLEYTYTLLGSGTWNPGRLASFNSSLAWVANAPV